MKLCKDCGINPRYSSKTGKVYSYCKSCQSNRVKQHQKTDKGKESLRKAIRNYQRKQNGFTPEMFNDMLFNQNFKCGICSIEINTSSHADHNHETGKARGILCSSCNTLLGRLESVGFDWILKAKEYLNKS